MLILISYSLNFPEIRCPVQVIRSTLVYVIIQPVRIQVVGMGPPGEEWFVVWIVIFVIVLRDFNRQTLGKVSFIFAIQSHAVVFRMSHNKDFTSSLCHCKEQTSLFAFRQDRKVFACMDICNRNFCVSGMRRKKYIIKAPGPAGSYGSVPCAGKVRTFSYPEVFSPGHKNDKDWPALPNRERSWKSHASQSNP